MIEINEVNYCIVDTTTEKIGCAVMCNTSTHTVDQKASYELKAAQIQENLNGVLTYLLIKVDQWRCTATSTWRALRAGACGVRRAHADAHDFLEGAAC